MKKGIKFRSKKHLTFFLSTVISISLFAGWLIGYGFLVGPETEQDSMEYAMELKSYLENYLNEEDPEVVIMQAKKMGKKNSLLLVVREDPITKQYEFNVHRDLGSHIFHLVDFTIAKGNI